jgi:hypothetical protein
MSQTYDTTENYKTLNTSGPTTLGFTTFTGSGISYFQLGATTVQNSGSAPIFDIAAMPSGAISITPVGSSPNAAGGVTSGSALTLEPANASFPGLLTAGAQAIGGSKTFINAISAPNITGSNTGDVTLINVSSSSNSAGATLFGQVLNLNAANNSFPGVLTASAQNIGGAKTFSSPITAPNISGTNTGDVTITTVGSSPNNSGAVLTGQVLTLEPADSSNPGLLTAVSQTIGGTKTFVNAIVSPNLSGTNTGDVVLTTLGGSPNTAGASLSGQVLTLQPANATNPGLLSAGTQTIAGAKTFPSGISAPSLTMSNGATLNPATIISSAGTQLTNVLVPRVPFGSDTFATSQSNNIFASINTFQDSITTDDIFNTDGGDGAPSYSFTNNPGTGIYNTGGALGIATNNTSAITYDIAQKGVASGYFFCNPTYGYQNYTIPAGQALAAGNWVKISTFGSGATTGSSTNIDTAAVDNQISYDDTPSTVMRASADVSFQTDTACTLQFGIYYDSFQEPSFSITTNYSLSGATLSGYVEALVPMNTDDYVEVWIVSDTNCTLSVINLNFRLTNIC